MSKHRERDDEVGRRSVSEKYLCLAPDTDAKQIETRRLLFQLQVGPASFKSYLLAISLGTPLLID
jgi:hypothetical protein